MCYHVECYEQRDDGFYVHGRELSPSAFNPDGQVLENGFLDRYPPEKPCIGPLLAYDGGQLIAPEELKLPDKPLEYCVVNGVLQRRAAFLPHNNDWVDQKPLFLVTAQGAFFAVHGDITDFNLFDCLAKTEFRRR